MGNLVLPARPADPASASATTTTGTTTGATTGAAATEAGGARESAAAAAQTDAMLAEVASDVAKSEEKTRAGENAADAAVGEAAERRHENLVGQEPDAETLAEAASVQSEMPQQDHVRPAWCGIRRPACCGCWRQARADHEVADPCCVCPGCACCAGNETGIRENDMGDEDECCAKARCCGGDLCGVLCTSIAWFTLVFCSAMVIFYLRNIPRLVLGPYVFFVAMAMFSHLMASFSDPGYVPRGTGLAKWTELSMDVRVGMRKRLEARREAVIAENEAGRQGEREVKLPDGTTQVTKFDLAPRTVLSDAEIAFKCERAVEKFRRKVRYCSVCKIFKPTSAHHCRTCGRCIERLDHHCPWIAGCVGELNLRYFLLFLFYVFVASVYSIVLFLYRSYRVVYYEPVPARQRGEPPVNPWGILGCIFAVVLCGFFCAFVVAMSCEQYEAVTTGIPGIDAMQQVGEDEELSLYRGLKKHACHGRGCSPLWFLPLPLGVLGTSRRKSARKKND